MAENKRYAPLRPEARPVGYSKLDASQQYAFDRLVKMLAGALSEIETGDQRKRTTAGQGLRAPPAWLDHDRARAAWPFSTATAALGRASC